GSPLDTYPFGRGFLYLLPPPRESSELGSECRKRYGRFESAFARRKKSAVNPARSPPAMITPSQTIPVASTRAAGAPNGANNNTRAASRTPIPPCVIGITAAIFASGHAKSHTRNGRTSPHEMPTSAVSRIYVP